MLGGFSVGAEDDEVCVALGRLIEDFIGEEACEDHGLDFDSGGLQGFGNRVQARLELGLAFGRSQRPGRGSGDTFRLGRRKGGGLGLYDVQEHDFGGEFSGEFRGAAGDVG